MAFSLIWTKATSAIGISKRLRNWLETVYLYLKRYTHYKQAENSEEVEQYFPGFLSAFIDAILGQSIPKPTDKRRRMVYYLGKKKRHTVKT